MHHARSEADPRPAARRLGPTRLAVLLTLVLALVPTIRPIAAGAGPGEGDLVSRINAERSARGLAPLAVDGRLVEHGRSHSAAMAAAGSVFHSLDLASAASGWERMGENVGRGSTVGVVHEAFMASPGHRDHILGDFTHVGVGTHEGEGGMLYVTVAFMRVAGAEPPSTPTTSSTTTTPPTPTTTTAVAAATPSTSPAGDASPATTAPRETGPATVQAAAITPPPGPSVGAIADRLAWHPTEPFLR